MTAYYNEWDAYAANWLRNLMACGFVAKGDVDERSIVDVRADDLKGYTQCHFFAGIGGWSSRPPGRWMDRRQTCLDRILPMPALQRSGEARRL
jgi:hypothetical protein